MAKRRTTYGKMERDRAKRAKAAAKRERRQERAEAGDDAAEEEADAPETPQVPQEKVLDQLARAHERFDAGELSFEEFEEQKASLLELLDV